jgi:signal transduction histidine kinase
MRRRLALLVAATTSLVVAAFLAPLILLVREIAADRALSAGARDAQNVAVLVGVASDRAELADLVAATNRTAGRSTSVLLPDGGLVGPPVPASVSVDLARSGRAFTAELDGGREILVPVETAAGRAVVRTAVSAALLRRGVRTALGGLVGLGVVLVGLAVVVADRLARWTLRPVSALADAARRLARGDLAARVRADGPPELAEVCTAVNALAQRIGELLAYEREAVADLSHRLRTPITALQLEAHGLADPAASARMLELVATVQRTVDRIIDEARRPVRVGVVAGCDAVEVVSQRVAFWAPLAEDQDRRLTLSLPPDACPVRLPVSDLAAMVDALLENVFAHTPDGTPFAVRLFPRPGGGASLVVSDGGPGLPGGEVTRRGRSYAGSTGLGLDIVRRAAEAAGGALLLGQSPAGGAQIRVDLGAASA